MYPPLQLGRWRVAAPLPSQAHLAVLFEDLEGGKLLLLLDCCVMLGVAVSPNTQVAGTVVGCAGATTHHMRVVGSGMRLGHEE